MTEHPDDALVHRLRNPPFGTETSERYLFHLAADRIEALTRELAAAKAEITMLRQLLHDVRLEASETIPPDGRAAAFAALGTIVQMITERAAIHRTIAQDDGATGPGRRERSRKRLRPTGFRP